MVGAVDMRNFRGRIRWEDASRGHCTHAYVRRLFCGDLGLRRRREGDKFAADEVVGRIDHQRFGAMEPISDFG